MKRRLVFVVLSAEVDDRVDDGSMMGEMATYLAGALRLPQSDVKATYNLKDVTTYLNLDDLLLDRDEKLDLFAEGGHADRRNDS